MAEAKGALAYWGAWKDVSLRFARKDEKSIPEHWRIFGQRRSPITDSPRLAANPANAMLNYLYALLEAETRFACLACGLDPGARGISRRPEIARLAGTRLNGSRAAAGRCLPAGLDRGAHLQRQGLRRDEKGRLPRAGAAHAHAGGNRAPMGERRCPGGRERRGAACLRSATQLGLPTPLTQSHRSAGRDTVRRNPKRPAPAPAKPAATCVTCGGPLPSPDRQFCDDCLPEERRRLNAKFLAASAAGLAKMHAAGRNPMYSEEGRRKLGEANARRCREAAEWNRTHERPEPEVFTREILPLLQTIDSAANEDGDGALDNDVREDSAWVRAASEALVLPG